MASISCAIVRTAGCSGTTGAGGTYIGTTSGGTGSGAEATEMNVGTGAGAGATGVGADATGLGSTGRSGTIPGGILGTSFGGAIGFTPCACISSRNGMKTSVFSASVICLAAISSIPLALSSPKKSCGLINPRRIAQIRSDTVPTRSTCRLKRFCIARINCIPLPSDRVS